MPGKKESSNVTGTRIIDRDINLAADPRSSMSGSIPAGHAVLLENASHPTILFDVINTIWFTDS
jgi:hypothetical protein